MKRFLAAASSFALALTLGSTISAAKGGAPQAALDGKTFEIHIVPEGGKGDTDHLMFLGGSFQSTACIQYQFAPAAYTARGSESKMTFESKPSSEAGGLTEWSGTITGDKIEGTMVWTPTGEGKKVKHTYTGAALPPLYERLGGVQSIATVVDAFVDDLLADHEVVTNPKVAESLKQTSPAALKYLVTELTCMVTGGPQRYSGKSMKESHKDLAITAAEWDAMAKDFVATLTKFNVPAHEQGELLTIVGTTKADIVAAPAMSTMRK